MMKKGVKNSFLQDHLYVFLLCFRCGWCCGGGGGGCGGVDDWLFDPLLVKNMFRI